MDLNEILRSAQSEEELQTELKTFSVHMRVTGSDRSIDPEAPESFVDEIKQRPHLSDGEATWDEEKTNAIRVVLSVDALSAGFAMRHMSEELLEIASACVMGLGPISVEVVDVLERGK